jgi:fucose 4-O-acetylase-like acetyltransferase
MGQRHHWMDALRGFAVVLIIVYHAGRAVQDVGGDAPAVAMISNDLFAPFRMPLLVFLSGMLLPASLRKPAKQFLWGKVSNIAWPYALWLIPQFFLDPPGEHWKGFLVGGTYLWFLVFIGIYYIVGFLTKPIHPLIVAAAAFAVAVLAEDGSKNGERLFFLLAVFMIGSWFSQHATVREFVYRSRWLLLVAAAIVVAYVAFFPQGGYQPISIVPSLAGVVLLIRGAMLVDTQRWVALFREAGKSSLVVYITHVVGMQLIALAIGPGSPLNGWLLYLFFLGAGCITATVFVVASRSSRAVGYLFSLSPRTRTPRAPQTPVSVQPSGLS